MTCVKKDTDILLVQDNEDTCDDFGCKSFIKGPQSQSVELCQDV